MRRHRLDRSLILSATLLFVSSRVAAQTPPGISITEPQNGATVTVQQFSF